MLVLVHRAGDTELEGVPGHPIVPLPESLVELYERLALRCAPHGSRPWPPTPAASTRRVLGPQLRRPSGRRGCPPTTLSVLARPPARRRVGRAAFGYNGPMTDPRVERLAGLLADYSLALGEGKVLRIDSLDAGSPLVLASPGGPGEGRAAVHQCQPPGSARPPPARVGRAADVPLADPVGGDRAPRRARDDLVGDEHAGPLACRSHAHAAYIAAQRKLSNRRWSGSRTAR